MERSTKNKNGKSPGEDNFNSEAGDSFHERLPVFENICMIGEMTEEWRNSTLIRIYKKDDKQKVGNYRGIILFNACYKLCSKILKEELKVQAGSSFWNARMDAEKAYLVSIHCLA